MIDAQSKLLQEIQDKENERLNNQVNSAEIRAV